MGGAKHGPIRHAFLKLELYRNGLLMCVSVRPCACACECRCDPEKDQGMSMDEGLLRSFQCSLCDDYTIHSGRNSAILVTI